MEKLDFERSAELKHLFNRYLELWKKKHRSGMEELARRCGVSASYLGHIGRYGRVPGKPVLILLAFNFELDDPSALFKAAAISDFWPYDEGLKLVKSSEADAGLLSVKLDMKGFTEIIREMIRNEQKPRSIRELTTGKPLRVGFNTAQNWFFRHEQAGPVPGGFFPELFKMVELGLQTECKVERVPFAEALEMIATGDLDLFGPLYETPQRLGKVLFTRPFCRIGLGALGRTRKCSSLPQIGILKSTEDLKKSEVEIAVLRDSQAHHFALSELGRTNDQLRVCDTPDEALERITLTGIKRPAHIMLCDTPIALKIHESQPNEYELLFCEARSQLTFFFDTVFAVRPDWPELLSRVNEVLHFLGRSDTVARIAARELPEELRGTMDFSVA